MNGRLQITVDLELEAGPIGGEISTGGNPGRPFRGWLELASAIEQLRVAAGPLASTVGPEPPGDGLGLDSEETPKRSGVPDWRSDDHAT
jgi:hypothetical protein